MLVAGYVCSLWVAPLLVGDKSARSDRAGTGRLAGGAGIAAETVRIRRERAVAADAARKATDRERAARSGC